MHVLLITIPIAPPWDEAKKNMALVLARESTGFKPHLLTTHSYMPDEKTDAVWESIYHRGGYGPLQKVSLLKRLLRRSDSVDVDHIFVDLNRRTAPIMRAVRAWRQKPTVQTFAALPHDATLPQLMVGDHYIAFSQHLGDRLRTAGAQQVTTVNPVVDLHRFDPLTVVPTPEQFGIPPGRKVVLYAGTFRTESDVEAVSSVIHGILAGAKDVHLVIASRIRRRHERMLRDECLKRLPASAVDKRMTILGTVRDIPSLMATCDVCILPATDLKQKLDIPLVLLESLAMRTAIVYTEVGGMKTLSDYDVGISVAHRAWTEFADAVVNLITNEQYCRRVVEQGYQVIHKHFSVSQFVEKHERVYNSVQ